MPHEDPSNVDFIETIPDPEVIRDEIRRCVDRTMVLRHLLRLSLKKAASRREAASREEVPLANGR
jgi:hypothetical protein